MPLFCDVALAVPLDMAFTYAIPPGMEPVVGGRVLVPFRQQRMSGIVAEMHDHAPQVKTKKVIEVLDLAPVLDEQLLKLGQKDPVFVPYFSIQFSTQWEASLEG